MKLSVVIVPTIRYRAEIPSFQFAFWPTPAFVGVWLLFVLDTFGGEMDK